MVQKTFVIRGRQQWELMVAFFRANWKADHPLAVVVSDVHAKRTVEQNSALHAVLRQIAEEAYVDGKQFSLTAWKEYFRDRFVANEKVDLPDGRSVLRHRSTTELSVVEMSELIDAVHQYAAQELGLEMDR